MKATTAALEVRDLSVRFDRATIVEGLNIVCAPETVTVLTGPNGAGKTTALNALNGMVRQWSGRVAIGGRRIFGRWTPRRAFAYGVRRTFQVPRNWPSLDLAENIVIASDVGWDQVRAHVRQELNLEIGRSPVTLSLGQRRVLEMLRVHFARGQCKIALLDEPLSGLDPSNRAKAFDSIRALQTAGAAVLIVDHEPDNWPDRDATVRLELPRLARFR